jgi:hypothetical protein
MAQYSDQDTERARQAEQSSAGLQTQQLGLPPASGTTYAPTPAVGRNNRGAIALVGVGVALLLLRMIPDSGAMVGGMILLTIASCFMFFAFWKRIYGLMIPGAILSGLSLGVPFADLTNGISILWGLALAFLAIFLLGAGLFGQRSHWPVYPAVVLFGVGVIVAVSSLPSLLAGGLLWLPLLLVGIGLYLGWGRRAA